MTVTTPPRPPRAGDVLERIEPVPVEDAELEALVEALIEEARQRARRRRRRNGAIAALVLLAGAAALSLLGRTSPATLGAPAAASAPVAAPARPTGTIALTGLGGRATRVFLWTPTGVRDSGIRGRAFGWSPDGSRLLVMRGSALYVARVGGGSVLLARHGNGFDAAWSPDGTRIAFQGGPVPGHPTWRRILVGGADGRGVRVLRGWAVDGGFFTGNVTWSPDGRHVVFAGRTASDRRFWLYRVAADGLTPPQQLVIDAPVRDPGQPTWSPDGTRLAFLGAVADNLGGLFVMRADGSGVRRVAVGGSGAVWSPDGSMLAFRTHNPGRAWTVRADGTHLRRLPPGSWFGLSWSPDSRHIAFAGGDSHTPNGDVYVVRPDGTGLVRILHRPSGGYGLPLWRQGTATTESG